MADAHANQHDYHLVNPSPWPIIGADRRLLHGLWPRHVFHLEEGRDARIFGTCFRAS